MLMRISIEGPDIEVFPFDAAVRIFQEEKDRRTVGQKST
jgi:hypothetical protein